MSPWIGPGPHDRHLDDEIVELVRLEARQHRHLRPALDLEHADGIGLAQHVVDRSGSSGRARRRACESRGRNDASRNSKPRRMQVSMPSASTSTFMRPSASMSSLSHSMKVRSSIAALPIGTVSSSRSRVRTKPPTCCERWRGKPMSSLARSTAWRICWIVGIEPGLAGYARRACLAAIAPDRLGERRGDVGREARAPCRPRGSRSASGNG